MCDHELNAQILATDNNEKRFPIVLLYSYLNCGVNFDVGCHESRIYGFQSARENKCSRIRKKKPNYWRRLIETNGEGPKRNNTK